MSRYVEQAVDALYTQVNADIAAKLTDVESDSGLSAGELPAPTVVKYEATNLNTSPLIQIFEQGFSPIDESGGIRSGAYAVPCKLVFTLRADADLSAAEVQVRRYVDAIMRSVVNDTTLGGSAVGCEFLGANAHVAIGDESTTRHGYEFDFDVYVQSATGG